MALSLDDIIDVKVNIAKATTTGRQFDLLLLLGETDVFSDRIKIYKDTYSMLQDGFSTTDRLYKACQLAFAQSQHPDRIAIGRIGDVTVANTAGEGQILLADALELNEEAEVGKYIYEEHALSDTSKTGYLEIVSDGDTPTDSQITLTDAQALNPDAAVGKYIDPNESYLLSDTEVQDSQLIIADTITRKENVEEVLTACRAENDEWYVVNFCKEMTDEEHIVAGQFCESCNPSAIYAFTSSDSNSFTNNENIFSKVKALNLKRTIGQYSTKHQDAIVSILSWALRLLSQNKANSAFTLKDKIEEGVIPETNVTSMNVKTLKENNGNIYVNRNGFTLFEDGKMANGDFFDEIAFLDKYKERMQTNIIKEMQSQNKIKQTEDGMAILKTKITEVCEEMFANGFIDSGVWKAESVLNLQTGDTLPNGYYIQSEPIDEQSQIDREARIAPPIYVSLKLAGAIHYLTIQIDVNR